LKDNFEAALTTAQIAVIDTGNRAIYRAFEKLHTHHQASIAYVQCRASKLSQTLEQCTRSGVFAVVLDTKPRYIPASPLSAAVIAPAVSPDRPYLRQLLQRTSLTGFSALAFQTYLTPASALEELHNRYFETLRLGAFRDNPAAAEPLLRHAEYVWFDLSALRATDAPRIPQAGPNGLYAEEACQLAHYIGLSDRAKALFLFGYRPCRCAGSRTVQFISQLLWHITDASAARIDEKIDENVAISPEFKEIRVDMGVKGQELYFINSLTTQRWWIKVPSVKGAPQWIPCLSADYQTACRGEVPLRWLWHYQKLNY
jgi:hypothetical protein